MLNEIIIKDLKVFAYHGVLPEERAKGNDFIVNLRMSTDFTKATETDRLEDTLNYADVCDIIREQMAIPSDLLEHVAGRIVNSIKEKYPTLQSIDLEVEKLNPPVSADCRSAAVRIVFDNASNAANSEDSRADVYPLLFNVNLHTLVWGTEEWNVSAVPSSPSIISNGVFRGRELPEIISLYPKEILGGKVAEKYNNELPLLVKFIDAQKDMSVQVHPDDAMAHRLHQKNGKTEMWYIIDADPGAFLYAGFKEPLSPEAYKKKVEDGTIIDSLARHEVHKGDVFFLPAGRVHAICGGIRLAEVQQSSDVTYRIYDYNRLGLDGKPRQLHTDLAAQAIDFEVLDEYKTDYIHPKGDSSHCIDSEFFCVRTINVDRPFHRNLLKFDSFIINTCISGKCKIYIRETGDEVYLKGGRSCLIPAVLADYDIIPDGSCFILDSFVDNMDRSLAAKASRFLHFSRT